MNKIKPMILFMCICGSMAMFVMLIADFLAISGEYLVKTGSPVRGMDYLYTSVRLAPNVTKYRIMSINCMVDLFHTHPQKEAKRWITTQMLNLGASYVKRRPFDSDSHYVLAFTARSIYSVTLEERYRILAEYEANKSLEMAPYFEPTMELLNTVRRK